VGCLLKQVLQPYTGCRRDSYPVWRQLVPVFFRGQAAMVQNQTTPYCAAQQEGPCSNVQHILE
jgi:hypothetical protein